MNNLLGVTLLQFLNNTLIIIGLCLIVLGLSIFFLAKRITRASRQDDNVNENDGLYIFLKVLGFVIVICGCVCISLDIIMYIKSR